LGSFNVPDLLKVGFDRSDEVVLAVGIPVVDVDLEGSVVVPVAEVSHLELGWLPDRVQVVLDYLALVDNGKLKMKIVHYLSGPIV